jgi:CRP/FNR family transcriptional regulator, cyclic AMP receptor protein
MAMPDEPGRGFWADLTGHEQAALRAIGSWSSFDVDEEIFTERKQPDDVAVIWSGLTKVGSRFGAPREVLLALRGPGDLVGEMACVAGGLRSATVRVIERVDALVVDGRAFAWFLRRFPHASAVVHRVLVTRLRHADQCRVSAGTTSVAQRLARLLLQLEQQYGVPANDGTKIAVTLSQQDLAAFVGASQRAVARVMESWRERDIVRTGRRRLTIRRLSELRRIAGSNVPP